MLGGLGQGYALDPLEDVLDPSGRRRDRALALLRQLLVPALMLLVQSMIRDHVLRGEPSMVPPPHRRRTREIACPTTRKAVVGCIKGMRLRFGILSEARGFGGFEVGGGTRGSCLFYF